MDSGTEGTPSDGRICLGWEGVVMLTSGRSGREKSRPGPALPLEGPAHPPIITMVDAEATEYVKQCPSNNVPLTGV